MAQGENNLKRKVLKSWTEQARNGDKGDISRPWGKSTPFSDEGLLRPKNTTLREVNQEGRELSHMGRGNAHEKTWLRGPSACRTG